MEEFHTYSELTGKKLETAPATKLPEFKDIQERNALLNKDADKRSVLTAIDRPILPLVLELNRIGLQTTFSCCGYSYVGEEEPKSHSKWAQVLFLCKNPKLLKIVDEAGNKTGWRLQPNPTNAYEQCLISRNIYDHSTWNQCDNLPCAIHDYEFKLHSITMLSILLRDIPSASDISVLRDGNEGRKLFYGKEWEIEPKQPATIIWKNIVGDQK